MSSAWASAPTELLLRTGDLTPAETGGAPIIQLGAPGVSTSDAVSVWSLSIPEVAPGEFESREMLLRRLPGSSEFEAIAWTGLETPLPGSFFEDFLFSLNPNDQVYLGFAPINASGDAVFTSNLVGPFFSEYGRVPGAFLAPADGPLLTAWEFPRPIPGIDVAEFSNGSTPPAVTDDGAFLARSSYDNAYAAVHRVDEDGASFLLDRFGDGPLFGWGEMRADFNARGDALVSDDPRSRRGTLLLRTASGEERMLIEEGGVALGDEMTDGAWIGDRVSIAGDRTGTFVGRLLLREPNRLWNGVFLVDGSGAVPIALLGEPALGFDGLFFDDFAEALVGSVDGVAFRSGLSDGAGEPVVTRDFPALWFAGGEGEIELVGRPGGEAPGTAGAVFEAVGGPVGPFNVPLVAINSRDDLVFFATLAPGIGDTEAEGNRVGLWGRDGATGEVSLIVRAGDTVDVSRPREAPDRRVVQRIEFNPLTGFADNGRLGYALEFTDGTFAAFTTFVGTPPTACRSDLSLDGRVDFTDFAVFVSLFDSAAGDALYDPIADFDLDGDIDFGDFAFFVTQFDRDDCAP